MGKKMVYSPCTSKSGTSLKACKSAIFGNPEICQPLCKSFMAFWPKLAELQARKVVADLLVHAVYTNFWPIFGTIEIYRPLCQSFMAFWPKIAEWQAFKLVPNLLVHAVYTNFLPIFGTPDIYQPLCKGFVAFWPKLAQLQAFKVVPDLLVHVVYTNFLPTFGIPEIYQVPTTVSKFNGVLTKNGRVTGLQSGAWFAGACSIHQFLANFGIPEIKWTTQLKFY